MCLMLSFEKVHYPASCPCLSASLNVSSNVFHHTGAGKDGQVRGRSVFMDGQSRATGEQTLTRTLAAPRLQPGYDGPGGGLCSRPTGTYFLICSERNRSRPTWSMVRSLVSNQSIWPSVSSSMCSSRCRVVKSLTVAQWAMAVRSNSTSSRSN